MTPYPLSLERRLTALSAAAITGVLVNGSLQLLRQAIMAPDVYGMDGFPFDFMFLYVLFGSFVAVPLCLLVGLPLWSRFERAGRRARSDAIRAGSIAGGVIGLAMTAFSLADGASWSTELLDLAGYCLAGALAALVARWIALSC
jgi:hypothetical protein